MCGTKYTWGRLYTRERGCSFCYQRLHFEEYEDIKFDEAYHWMPWTVGIGETSSHYEKHIWMYLIMFYFIRKCLLDRNQL